METVDRSCPKCGKVYKQPLSCGSWACWRCSDRRTGSNNDWTVFKIYEVIQAIRRKTGKDYAGPFWQFEGTAPKEEDRSGELGKLLDACGSPPISPGCLTNLGPASCWKVAVEC